MQFLTGVNFEKSQNIPFGQARIHGRKPDAPQIFEQIVHRYFFTDLRPVQINDIQGGKLLFFQQKVTDVAISVVHSGGVHH